jgi:biopolymer transport protein ExbB/TolQ
LERGEAIDLGAASQHSPNVVYAVLAACRNAAGGLAFGDDRDAFEAQVSPLLRGEALLRRRSLRVVAMFAAAMPLLGLLGTVLGMTQTFSAFTSRGVSQVDMLADGISQALITTQAGLVATVPVLLAHSLLAARVRRYLDTAELFVKRIESILCKT